MQTLPHNSPLTLIAIQAALKAGDLLRKGFGAKCTIAYKANEQDLVTEFDKAAEQAIIDLIRENFPDHLFLAEEGGGEHTHAPTHAHTNSVLWIIDPLDGTMNFAHHIPIFAVNIAAMVNNEIEVAVTYQPMTGELFVAQKGCGAYLNGSRLHVSEITEMKYAVAATGFAYGTAGPRQQSIEQFLHLLDMGNPIRLIGSAALALAYVAAGRFDAFWGINLKPWDVAAGKLMISEAGGVLTHFDGSAHDMFKQNTVVASNKHLHHSILHILTSRT